MSKIEINNVYKIFGPKPNQVLKMVKAGSGKDEILEKTGHTVGLDNVSLKIEEGETFVCMGLSGSGKSTLIRHLNRLIDPTDGEILVEGTNVMSLNKEKLIEFIDIVGPFGTLLITGHDFGNSRKLWESSFTKMSESVEPILSKYLKQKFAA